MESGLSQNTSMTSLGELKWLQGIQFKWSSLLVHKDRKDVCYQLAWCYICLCMYISHLAHLPLPLQISPNLVFHWPYAYQGLSQLTEAEGIYMYIEVVHCI